MFLTYLILLYPVPSWTVFKFTTIYWNCSNETFNQISHVWNCSNKTSNQMQQSIVKLIVLSYRRWSTCFGHYCAHHQEPVKLPLQPLVSVWMRRWTCFQPWSVWLTNRPRLETRPPPHSYGNQRLQRQFGGLLMMGIIMPETCWEASIWQNNEFYDWLLHLVGCFVWVIEDAQNHKP
jgi:hypothetical protein